MKRAIVVVAAGVALGALAIVGPELWAYHRFGQALERQVEASQAEGGAWPPLHETCFFCHGPQGQPANAQYPALAGQPAAYLEQQLRAFAGGQRRSATMAPLAGHLSDAQIRFIAAYYARQAPSTVGDAPADPMLEQRGAATVQARSCRACHGEALMGKDLAPRLAGQGESYLAKQLAAFKAGERHDPSGAMDGIAGTLAGDDITAVARYLARLPLRRDLTP